MAKTLKSTDEIGTIRKDLEAISGDLKNLTKHVETQGKMTAADLKAKAQENYTHLKDKAQENITNLQDYSKDQLAVVEKEIRAKPAQSVAIAFGAGILLSALFRRK